MVLTVDGLFGGEKVVNGCAFESKSYVMIPSHVFVSISFMSMLSLLFLN